MTPAERAVISDMLRGCRSHGVALSEETVARMLRAVDLEYLRTFAAAGYALGYARGSSDARDGVYRTAEELIALGDKTVRLVVSPAETPTAASPLHPSGETVCSRCGMEERTFGCGCDQFPGAGAG